MRNQIRVYFLLCGNIFSTHPVYLSINLPELSQQTLNQRLISHMHLLLPQTLFLASFSGSALFSSLGISCSTSQESLGR